MSRRIDLSQQTLPISIIGVRDPWINWDSRQATLRPRSGRFIAGKQVEIAIARRIIKYVRMQMARSVSRDYCDLSPRKHEYGAGLKAAVLAANGG